MTSSEIREKLNGLYDQFRPTAVLYRQYAESVAALSIEFHKARLAEAYPGARFEEFVLVATLDLRESPASLEKALKELEGVTIKKFVFDPVAFTVHLFK